MSQRNRKGEQGLIPLNAEQLAEIKWWAERPDDRWGNDEARQINLTTFARCVLKAATAPTQKLLEELCISIFAHAANDYEITLSGNGTNACEASNVAYAILDLLHGDGRKWCRANQKFVDKKAQELRKLYE